MKNISDLNYYAAMPVERVLHEQKTSLKGLSQSEAEARLKQYGLNVVGESKEFGIVLELLSHFKSPLIIVLLVATSISAYLGEITNSLIIGSMILFSVLLDFFNEHSANQSVKKLKEKIKTKTTVIRNGQEQNVDLSHVCPGDVIFLSSGDLIPADCRVLVSDDFFVSQASLTGESFPCAKTNLASQSIKQNLAEYTNMVFLGSSVVSGTATVVALHTGQQTEYGRLAHNLQNQAPKSDFEIGTVKFSYFIMKVVIFLVLFIFLFNSLLNRHILESFIFAIAVAVGVTPEFLPMIMTIAMSRGSARMSKKGVIVKKLSAIPNFGSMDILCTDKTGTLTEDKIRLVKYTDVFGQPSETVLLHVY